MYSAQIIKNMNTGEFIAIFKIGICNFILEPIREYKSPGNKDNYMKEKEYFYKLSRYEGNFTVGLKYFYTKFEADKFSKENLEVCIDKSLKYILGNEYDNDNYYDSLTNIGFKFCDMYFNNKSYTLEYSINDCRYTATIERTGNIDKNSFLGFVFTICDNRDNYIAVKTNMKCADLYTLKKCIYEYHSSIKEQSNE